MLHRIESKGGSKAGYRFLGSTESVVSGFAFPAAPQQKSFLLLFIRSGTGELVLDGREWSAAPGNLFLLRFGLPYLLKSTPSLRLTELLIGGIPDRLSSFYRFRPGSDVEKLMNAVIGSQSEPGSVLPALEQLIALLRTTSGDRAALVSLDRLKSILDSRYAERLKMSQCAEEIHWNKFRLAREFKAEFGISPIEYLINRRIQEAGRLLMQTDDSVADIGNKVGMENTPYFIRTFKRKTGLTPGSFRSDSQRSAESGPFGTASGSKKTKD